MHANYDAKELAKFSALASHWWDPEGELKTLHQMNPIRRQYIKEKSDVKDKTVLDIGCGGGILTESLAADGAIVTGIDLNPKLIEIAKLHQYESKTNIEYLVTPAEEFASLRQNYYDIVTCFELLEHVPDPAAIIKACSMLLKPNGIAFFSTLNRNAKAYFYAIIGAEYLLRLLPKHTHDFAKFIRPSELAKALREAELNLIDMKGISYHPIQEKFSLNQDISVNYLCYAQKLES